MFNIILVCVISCYIDTELKFVVDKNFCMPSLKMQPTTKKKDFQKHLENLLKTPIALGDIFYMESAENPNEIFLYFFGALKDSNLANKEYRLVDITSLREHNSPDLVAGEKALAKLGYDSAANQPRL